MADSVATILSQFDLPDETISELSKLYRERKRQGARSLAKLGSEMRRTQKEYFDTKNSGALRRSKELEKQFDRACRAILENL